MRLNSIEIRNFRAIAYMKLTGLGSTVVLAGPNGCGKSCVLDAIRLLKSIYGGYQANEWHQWFTEFQIKHAERADAFLPLFQDKSRPMVAEATFSLADSEREFLRSDALSLLTESHWRQVSPETAGWNAFGAVSLATNRRAREPEVQNRVKNELPSFLKELDREFHTARLSISPSGRSELAPSRVLEIVFSRYDAEQLGVIDYHGAARNYGREQITGINLNLDTAEKRLKQHALYGHANKYTNVKSELAAGFIRDMLAQRSGAGTIETQHSLVETLKELFATFFPGKEFLGPQPTKDGSLTFPVRTSNGAVHEIDELSAGEKEVLFGYLRLRNSAPRHSVIMIDEPEIHLNPRLVRGLAGFYHKHLGESFGNQLWLVTHSDALIREAVGRPEFTVYHMQPAGKELDNNQAQPVKAVADVERVVVDLVGDLAAYRPGAKIVVFEGTDDTEFDVSMTGRLFPEFINAVNPISGGNKRRVIELYELFSKASQANVIPARIFAITDGDGEQGAVTAPTRFQWDVYHIENYLLVDEYILRVLREIDKQYEVWNVADVQQRLNECAVDVAKEVQAHRLHRAINEHVHPASEVRLDRRSNDLAAAAGAALTNVIKRVGELRAGVLSDESLEQRFSEIKSRVNEELQDGRWMVSFPGRSVLRRFVGRLGLEIPYETFRYLVIARMHDAGYKPQGMKKVISAILEA